MDNDTQTSTGHDKPKRRKHYRNPKDLTPDQYERRRRNVEYIKNTLIGAIGGAGIGYAGSHDIVPVPHSFLPKYNIESDGNAIYNMLTRAGVGAVAGAGVTAFKHMIRDYLGYSGVRGTPVYDISYHTR